MKRRNLILPFLKLLFTKPSVILKALYHAVTNANRKEYMIKQYGLKEGLPQIDLLDVFPDMNETIHSFTHLYGTSLPIDICVLKMLAKKYNECDYFEIGTWRGESMVNIAPVAKYCVSLSLSDKEMHSIGYGEKFTRVQRFFSKHLPNVEHIQHNSQTFNFDKFGRKFDLIFVDGDHSYDGVRIDTQNVFKLLKDEKSVIVWHDYTTQYEYIDWEVFAGIFDGAPENKRSKIHHLSNTLCAIYINGDFKTKKLDFPTYPDKEFTVSISGKKIQR